MERKLINFSVPTKLLFCVDQLAEQEFRSRSELLREAVRFYLATKPLREETLVEVVSAAAARNSLTEKQAVKLVDAIREELPMNQ